MPFPAARSVSSPPAALRAAECFELRPSERSRLVVASVGDGRFELGELAAFLVECLGGASGQVLHADRHHRHTRCSDHVVVGIFLRLVGRDRGRDTTDEELAFAVEPDRLLVERPRQDRHEARDQRADRAHRVGEADDAEVRGPRLPRPVLVLHHLDVVRLVLGDVVHRPSDAGRISGQVLVLALTEVGLLVACFGRLRRQTGDIEQLPVEVDVLEAVPHLVLQAHRPGGVVERHREGVARPDRGGRGVDVRTDGLLGRGRCGRVDRFLRRAGVARHRDRRRIRRRVGDATGRAALAGRRHSFGTGCLLAGGLTGSALPDFTLLRGGEPCRLGAVAHPDDGVRIA